MRHFAEHEYPEFIDKYLEEYNPTGKTLKRLAIAMVILPMYERLRGQKYTAVKSDAMARSQAGITKTQNSQMK